MVFPRTQENLFTYAVPESVRQELRFIETGYLPHLITNLDRTEISSGFPIGKTDSGINNNNLLWQNAGDSIFLTQLTGAVFNLDSFASQLE
jgi:hypothetical protein